MTSTPLRCEEYKQHNRSMSFTPEVSNLLSSLVDREIIPCLVPSERGMERRRRQLERLAVCITEAIRSTEEKNTYDTVTSHKDKLINDSAEHDLEDHNYGTIRYYIFGSVNMRTVLPDGDNDVTIEVDGLLSPHKTNQIIYPPSPDLLAHTNTQLNVMSTTAAATATSADELLSQKVEFTALNGSNIVFASTKNNHSTLPDDINTYKKYYSTNALNSHKVNESNDSENSKLCQNKCVDITNDDNNINIINSNKNSKKNEVNNDVNVMTNSTLPVTTDSNAANIDGSLQLSTLSNGRPIYAPPAALTIAGNELLSKVRDYLVQRTHEHNSTKDYTCFVNETNYHINTSGLAQEALTNSNVANDGSKLHYNATIMNNNESHSHKVQSKEWDKPEIFVEAFVPAEVRVLKVVMEGCSYDLTINQFGGVNCVRFLHEMDRLIGHSHLLKRTLLLLKSWASYEAHILGGQGGYLSSYAITIMLIALLNTVEFVEDESEECNIEECNECKNCKGNRSDNLKSKRNEQTENTNKTYTYSECKCNINNNISSNISNNILHNRSVDNNENNTTCFTSSDDTKDNSLHEHRKRKEISPLRLVARFIKFYRYFDYDNYCVTAFGALKLSVLNNHLNHKVPLDLSFLENFSNEENRSFSLQSAHICSICNCNEASNKEYVVRPSDKTDAGDSMSHSLENGKSDEQVYKNTINGHINNAHRLNDAIAGACDLGLTSEGRKLFGSLIRRRKIPLFTVKQIKCLLHEMNTSREQERWIWYKLYGDEHYTNLSHIQDENANDLNNHQNNSNNSTFLSGHESNNSNNSNNNNVVVDDNNNDEHNAIPFADLNKEKNALTEINIKCQCEEKEEQEEEESEVEEQGSNLLSKIVKSHSVNKLTDENEKHLPKCNVEKNTSREFQQPDESIVPITNRREYELFKMRQSKSNFSWDKCAVIDEKHLICPSCNILLFPVRSMNVLDPLRWSSNMVRGICRNHAQRILKAFEEGLKRFDKASEILEESSKQSSSFSLSSSSLSRANLSAHLQDANVISDIHPLLVDETCRSNITVQQKNNYSSNTTLCMSETYASKMANGTYSSSVNDNNNHVENLPTAECTLSEQKVLRYLFGNTIQMIHKYDNTNFPWDNLPKIVTNNHHMDNDESNSGEENNNSSLKELCQVRMPPSQLCVSDITRMCAAQCVFPK